MGPVSIPEEVIMCKPHYQGIELVNGMVLVRITLEVAFEGKVNKYLSVVLFLRLYNGHVLMNQANYLRSHDRFQLPTWSSTFRTLLKRRLRMKGAKYAHVTSSRFG